MAGQQGARKPPRQESIDEFMARSRRELGTRGSDAAAAAHQAYGRAIQSDQDLQLRSPSEVMAHGVRLRQVDPANAPPEPSGAAPTAPPSNGSQGLGGALQDAALQADTAVRSAANTLTFHGADHFAAGMDALLQRGGLENWPQRYVADLARQKLRNSLDARDRPTAQAMGNVAGTGLGLALLGPMEGRLAAAPRLVGAAPLTVREGAGLLAGGAGVGLGFQALSDLLQGRRSTAGDNIGAALGGAAGVAALPLGPARAGAVQGAVTSTAQDVLNGRAISTEDAGESALLGNLLGGLGGVGGRRWSNDLPMKAKGQFGEAVGDARRLVNGYGWRPVKTKTREYLEKVLDNGKKGYWIPDDVSGDVRFEDKFGAKAKLRPRQMQAQRELGTNFWLSHILPADVGKAASVPAAAGAPQIVDRRRAQ